MLWVRGLLRQPAGIGRPRRRLIQICVAPPGLLLVTGGLRRGVRPLPLMLGWYWLRRRDGLLALAVSWQGLLMCMCRGDVLRRGRRQGCFCRVAGLPHTRLFSLRLSLRLLCLCRLRL